MGITAKKRVLFVIPGLQGGGAERVAMTLLEHLDRDRFELELLVVNLEDAVFACELPADVRLTNLCGKRLRQVLFALTRHVRRRTPDVVVSFVDHMNLALLFAKPFFGKTALVQYMTSSFSIEQPGWRAAFWALGRNAERLIFQSNEMAAVYGDKWRDQAVVIYNPVDLVRIRQHSQTDASLFDKEKINLVASGRLHWIKGFDLLIKAIHDIKRQDIVLTILGDGPQKSSLEKQISDLGLQSRVRMVGFQSNPFPYYAQADALVLSSRQEGLPNVVIEAMALGTPIIATPVSSIREILSDVPECRVTIDCSAGALTEAIVAVATSLRDRRVGAEATKKFDVSNIVREYEGVFESA